jgi:hypothetical protein
MSGESCCKIELVVQQVLRYESYSYKVKEVRSANWVGRVSLRLSFRNGIHVRNPTPSGNSNRGSKGPR